MNRTATTASPMVSGPTQRRRASLICTGSPVASVRSRFTYAPANIFDQSNRCATPGLDLDVKLVHERPSQIDSPARFLQQCFGRPRIGQAIQVETIALIRNCDRELFPSLSDGHEDLLWAV